MMKSKKREATGADNNNNNNNMFATDMPGFCPDLSSNPDHWSSTKEELLRRAFQRIR